MVTIRFLSRAKQCLPTYSLLGTSNTISYAPLLHSSSLPRDPLPFTARKKAGISIEHCGKGEGPALRPTASPVNEQRGPEEALQWKRPQTPFPLVTLQAGSCCMANSSPTNESHGEIRITLMITEVPLTFHRVLLYSQPSSGEGEQREKRKETC